MARRISAVGWVTVSLRRSIAARVLRSADEATSGCSSFDGMFVLSSKSDLKSNRHPDDRKTSARFLQRASRAEGPCAQLKTDRSIPINLSNTSFDSKRPQF